MEAGEKGGRARAARGPAMVADVVACLEAGDFLGGRVAYDQFRQAPVVLAPLPWDTRAAGREWCELDDHLAYAEAQRRVGVRNRRDFDAALYIAMRAASHDSLSEWLRGLPEWDGVERATGLLSDYLGVEDTPLARAAWANFMCGAVTRGLVPGSKYDCVPVLVGPQGCGKSTFARLLSPRDDWYLDGPSDLASLKGSAEQMRGKWICELSELAGMGRRETETVKAAITRQVDTYRPPYARRAVDAPRRAVFVGTTNREDFLQDGTGGRRFLPFRCGVARPRLDVHDEGAARARIGLAWAEVMGHWRESGGFGLALAPEVESALAASREGFEAVDDRVGIVRAYLEELREDRVCVSMVAEEALGVDRARVATDRALARELADILTYRCPGWVRVDGKRRVSSGVADFGPQRCWEREG